MSDSPRALETGGIIILIAALVYVGGWSYAYHWYDYFELGLIGLDIPFRYHFMYGFWVLQSYWWLVLLIALLLVAVLVFRARLAPILVPATPLWIFLAFLSFYSLGKFTADARYWDHQASGFRNYSWVRVWIKPDSGDLPTKLQKVQQDLAEGDKYRLLLETVHALYLIRPDQDADKIPTLQVQRDRVRAMRRIPTIPGS
ncbi:hypothetical protein [Candidatus Thiosymbion oneisti]|uniref:hypothetical protein n=1 Tax=Candidatus Thiosymbion oneisti TaxID=589554 RepID=UPI000B7F4DCA|nr:hypothetical protein [Candidatus Thiosymbion oneisti]